MGSASSKHSHPPERDSEIEGEIMRKCNKGVKGKQSPRQIMERVTGLRLKKACRNWNRQTGGRWPKEGTLNIWETECCETLLERRGHGCCNRGMYRPEYYFRWKSVALLRARKPREQLSDKESRVMVSREERGADPTAAVSPPEAGAEKRKKPNSDIWSCLKCPLLHCRHLHLVLLPMFLLLFGELTFSTPRMKVEMREDGLTVTSEALGLFCLSEKDNFAAWWLVDDTIMRDCIPEGQDQPDRLHCTAQFFGKGGGAEWTRDFETAGELRETVVLDYLYVAEDKSAASVRLSAGQEQWYVGGSVPHVSYGKKGSLEWKDLGPWVAECEKRTEWVRVEEGRWMSGDGQVQRYEIDQCVEVQRKGDAIEDKEKGIDPLPDWLGDVPDCLWAKGKNFGRVVSAEPLVAHLKSDSRPHKAQYPLSREAEEGVREVHTDLVKRGAIKEIAYSPVNSPIIPVQKANGTWSFVPDLRGVNAAIHPRAPIVPNPITIMASIPAEAKWFSIIDLANAFFSIPVDPDS
ncbi:uncharacterized protein [Paramormyrops kingsleyae]|uniref:uncharacterized protein n=1 Tax=Paramormyrops kingsleyae TaxID=1676925 RepID=UPI003B971399